MNENLATHQLLGRVEDLIGPELAEVEQIFANELRGREACVRDIFAHVTRFRGKRLRPMLVLLSARAAGRLSREHLVLAAVVDMIHTATLIHDDVLDEAETRRHVATVNVRWNNETSVLFGDYLFTHAFHLASSLDTTYACRLIGRSTNIVCEGELAQISERGNLYLSESRYLEIIDAKTAELCAVCCRLGAHYAGATPAVCNALETYGRSLGVAFQIADDLLDLLGDEAEVGKSLGADLEQQKLTLPVIRLLQTSPEPRAAHLRELLAQPACEAWPRLRALLIDSDAIDYATLRAVEFARKARRQLDSLPSTVFRAVLETITEFAVRRSF